MLVQDPATLVRPGSDPGASAPPTQSSMPVQPKIDVAGMNFFYGDNHVLHDVTVKMAPNHVVDVRTHGGEDHDGGVPGLAAALAGDHNAVGRVVKR